MTKLLERTILYMLILLQLFGLAYAQAKIEPLPIEMLADSMNQKPKAILVLVATDWCSYCQLQKARMAKSKELRDVSQYVYYVELSAEAKDTIVFDGQPYSYLNNGPSSGIHELAVHLAEEHGRVAYPTLVLLDNNYQVVFRFQGLLSKDATKALNNYFRMLSARKM
ncbi:thioredoxin family protein [Olivibacter sitiensis]|uniref:thioredoxin family protein n=1 Tax=Olivibacter sitiensis TaxID=376470 RepID=UPI000419275C|nr:thioredoxin fold domain-containing protein [Olivibacter sitiensis]